jgi:AAA domain
VPRLTKSDIEKELLTGAAVPWTDAAGKPATTIQLVTAKQRRLFAYLLKSKIRDVKGVPQAFIDGLAASHIAAGDPAAPSVQQTVNPSASGPWKIQALKIEGFGGVNIWNGKPFELTIDMESLLMEGPNGSGKSSLNAAIIWALTGERPRDQGDGSLDEAKPVFDQAGKRAGMWPPVASYPPDIESLKTLPNVSVEIVFSNASGMKASARRHFDGKTVTYTADPALQIPTILFEAGLLMPARMPHLRLDEGRGRLTDAVQKLTGLDELIELAAFIQGLCHSSRDYLAYKKAELASSKTEFDKQIERARTALSPVTVDVPNFKPLDTDAKDGAMAKFGKQLNDKAAELISIISSDLAADLVLADPKVQQRIIVALNDAERNLSEGMSSLPTWKLVKTIAAALPKEDREDVRSAVAEAGKTLHTAVAYFQKQQADSKFRLKASGAHWHINPRLTAAPVVAKLSTLTTKKIVGVLYNAGKTGGAQSSEMEIVEMGGEAAITMIMSAAKGLVEVDGHSAEPQALDKQFLIIGDSLPLKDAEKKLDGCPVIAEDSDQSRYFKRLRVDANNVILESLEIGGNFPPILLAKAPGLLRHVTWIWPVLGVLFEKP